MDGAQKGAAGSLETSRNPRLPQFCAELTTRVTNEPFCYSLKGVAPLYKHYDT